MLALGSQAWTQQALAQQVLAQSDDQNPEMRIEQLENQLRQLTGQNEELQYRNRQLEERLKSFQGGAQGAPVGQPNIAAVAMPSIPTKIRTLPARRVRSAVDNSRSRPKRRSVRPAGVMPANRSILGIPIRGSPAG
jgi:TolA-binding protein